MVPSSYANFFVASAGAAAALVGLLFIAISIAPDQVMASNAPVRRQTIASSAFTALLNAFLVSLIALMPGVNLAWGVLSLGGTGLLNSLLLTWSLFRHKEQWSMIVRGIILILASFVLYGYEVYFGVLMLQMPNNVGNVAAVAVLMVGCYALGLTRSWELLGGRTNRLSELLVTLYHAGEQRREHETAAKKEREQQAGAQKD